MDDRHARHRHRPADPRRRPWQGYRSGDARRFDRLVAEALRAVPAPLLEQLSTIEVHVAELPPTEPAGSTAPVALAAVRTTRSRGTATQPSPDRLVLYRRPLEARARDRAELTDLLRRVVVHELARQLGIDEDGIEERGWQ